VPDRKVAAMGAVVEGGVAGLRARYEEVRKRTLALCKPLTAEDMMVQSCAEASPAKWHLAHTAWFFESFVLVEFGAGYRVFDADFGWLFNSYYGSIAGFPDKRLRASFSRPGLEKVLAYRAHVDAGVELLLEGDVTEEALRRVELGLHHEEQHQELLLTDIQHALWTNPLRPVYLAEDAAGDAPDVDGIRAGGAATEMEFAEFKGGLVEIGHDGAGFSFDNERPRHRVWLEPYGVGTRLVTCGEYAGFIADGGYRRAELWLSDGWRAVQERGWETPLYWRKADGEWRIYSLRGERALGEVTATPVAHVSLYEADAYARWAGKRLATEAEWEHAAASAAVVGNLLDRGRLRPEVAAEGGLQQMFGDCWEWTGSAYLGYPGFKPLAGALGEYNGKFMSGQMVLRGGSCVTPEAHIRASYRNFFGPETRWQFSGIRLAEG